MGESLELLKKQVAEIELDEKAFTISLGENGFIFGIIAPKSKTRPDFFSISSIYNTILDLNHKIRFSFYMAAELEPSESLSDYDFFGNITEKEYLSLYAIENMSFRVEILWDMLAQLYNEFWCIDRAKDKIHYNSFFHNVSQGKNGQSEAKKIYDYLIEPDDVREATERWGGNHQFAKEYRNEMMHRSSPNITTFSNYNCKLRRPAMYALKRITEDYLMAIEFIQSAVKKIAEYFAKNPPL